MIPLLPPFLLLSLLPCLLLSFGGVVDKAEPAATLSPPCALSLLVPWRPPRMRPRHVTSPRLPFKQWYCIVFYSPASHRPGTRPPCPPQHFVRSFPMPKDTRLLPPLLTCYSVTFSQSNTSLHSSGVWLGEDQRTNITITIRGVLYKNWYISYLL